jgi:hypothetical protein
VAALTFTLFDRQTTGSRKGVLAAGFNPRMRIAAKQFFGPDLVS